MLRAAMYRSAFSASRLPSSAFTSSACSSGQRRSPPAARKRCQASSAMRRSPATSTAKSVGFAISRMSRAIASTLRSTRNSPSSIALACAKSMRASAAPAGPFSSASVRSDVAGSARKASIFSLTSRRSTRSRESSLKTRLSVDCAVAARRVASVRASPSASAPRSCRARALRADRSCITSRRDSSSRDTSIASMRSSCGFSSGTARAIDGHSTSAAAAPLRRQDGVLRTRHRGAADGLLGRGARGEGEQQHSQPRPAGTAVEPEDRHGWGRHSDRRSLCPRCTRRGRRHPRVWIGWRSGGARPPRRRGIVV